MSSVRNYNGFRHSGSRGRYSYLPATRNLRFQSHFFEKVTYYDSKRRSNETVYLLNSKCDTYHRKVPTRISHAKHVTLTACIEKSPHAFNEQRTNESNSTTEQISTDENNKDNNNHTTLEDTPTLPAPPIPTYTALNDTMRGMDESNLDDIVDFVRSCFGKDPVNFTYEQDDENATLSYNSHSENNGSNLKSPNDINDLKSSMKAKMFTETQGIRGYNCNKSVECSDMPPISVSCLKDLKDDENTPLTKNQRKYTELSNKQNNISEELTSQNTEKNELKLQKNSKINMNSQNANTPKKRNHNSIRSHEPCPKYQRISNDWRKSLSHKSCTDSETENEPPRELVRHSANTVKLDKQLVVLHNLNKMADIRRERSILLKVPIWYRKICQEQGIHCCTTPFAKAYPTKWQFFKDIIHESKSVSEAVTPIMDALRELVESNRMVKCCADITPISEDISPKEKHEQQFSKKYLSKRKKRSLFRPCAIMASALEPVRETEVEVNNRQIENDSNKQVEEIVNEDSLNEVCTKCDEKSMVSAVNMECAHEEDDIQTTNGSVNATEQLGSLATLSGITDYTLIDSTYQNENLVVNSKKEIKADIKIKEEEFIYFAPSDQAHEAESLGCNDNHVDMKMYSIVEVKPEVIMFEPTGGHSITTENLQALTAEQIRKTEILTNANSEQDAIIVNWSILYEYDLCAFPKDVRRISNSEFDSKLFEVFKKCVNNEHLFNGGLFKNGKSIPRGMYTTALSYKLQLLACAKEFQKILCTYHHGDDPTTFLGLVFSLSEENPCVYASCLLRLLLCLTGYDNWIIRIMNYLGILYYINPGAYESVMNCKFDQIEESVKLELLSTLKKFNAINLKRALGDETPTNSRMNIALRQLLCCYTSLGSEETLLSFSNKEVLSCHDIMVLWLKWTSTDPKIKINTPKELDRKCAPVGPPIAPEQTTIVQPPIRNSFDGSRIFGSTQCDPVVPLIASVQTSTVRPIIHSDLATQCDRMVPPMPSVLAVPALNVPPPNMPYNMHIGNFFSGSPSATILPQMGHLPNMINSVHQATAPLVSLASRLKKSSRIISNDKPPVNTQRGTLNLPSRVSPMCRRNQGDYYFFRLQQIILDMRRRGETIPEEWQRE